MAGLLASVVLAATAGGDAATAAIDHHAGTEHWIASCVTAVPMSRKLTAQAWRLWNALTATPVQ